MGFWEYARPNESMYVADSLGVAAQLCGEMKIIAPNMQAEDRVAALEVSD
jgi:hypothetical protein